MKNKLLTLQTIVLLAGTLFSWFTVFSDFSRFYNIYGSLTRVSGCAIPNPITTPCFYGAFAFLIAFIWSAIILVKSKTESTDLRQTRLNYLLIAGTMFAWSNFGYEIFKFYSSESGVKLSCSGIPTDNVFLTPCFFGSLIFLAALVISLRIIKKHNLTEGKY